MVSVHIKIKSEHKVTLHTKENYLKEIHIQFSHQLQKQTRNQIPKD